MTIITTHSPAPWTYDYSPYTLRATGSGGDGTVGDEIPAFEIIDADGNKLFDTNENMPCENQEANARLASCAPDLLAALNRCAILLADYDEHDGEEGDAYRDAIAIIIAATTARTER